MRTRLTQLIMACTGLGALGAPASATALERLHRDLSGFESLSAAAVLLDERTGWLSWQVPALDGQRSSCCWQGHWPDGWQSQGARTDPPACQLDQRIQGTSSHGQSPITSTIRVLARLESGQVEALIAVGESCPIRGAVTLIDGGVIEARLSNRWMDQLVQPSPARSDAADNALAVIGVTGADDRIPLLDGYARDLRGPAGQQALFWLSQGHQAQELAALEALLEDLPPGDRRRSINFALSQHGSDRAWDRLYAIARSDHDPEQRGDALFWLAEGAQQRGDSVALAGEIVALIKQQEHPGAGERALHALSTIAAPAGPDALAELGRTHALPSIRGRSLFWLAQVSPERARPLLFELLEALPDGVDPHQTVFALSQLPREQATASLMQVATGAYPTRVRKQALFWLVQSDDPAASSQLETLLRPDPEP